MENDGDATRERKSLGVFPFGEVLLELFPQPVAVHSLLQVIVHDNIGLLTALRRHLSERHKEQSNALETVCVMPEDPRPLR